jgi:hypothetical protein
MDLKPMAQVERTVKSSIDVDGSKLQRFEQWTVNDAKSINLSEEELNRILAMPEDRIDP